MFVYILIKTFYRNRVFESVRSVISATFFLQFLVTAIALCVTAVRFVFFDHGIVELILTIALFLCILMETFPICYFGSVLMEHTNQLTFALYNCNWMEQDQKFRKTLIVFMERSQRTNVFLAGCMIPITLQTFISVS